MTYVDGFLLPCPTEARETYIEIAALGADVFRRHGAIEVVEAWGDDVPDGTLTSMPMAVKKEAGETVVFSWVTWPDKATRDAGMKAFMEDESIKGMFDRMPFDGKRMMYGGFSTVVDIAGERPGTGYVDGIIAAVPEASRAAYVTHAEAACRLFLEHGAGRCVENWGDDVPDGVLTSFPMAVKKEAGETVVFSYILWADKAARDAGWKAIMADERMTAMGNLPFDGKRMVYGGFAPVVHAG